MGFIWFLLCIMTMIFWVKLGDPGYLELAKLFAVLTCVAELTTPFADRTRSRRDWLKVDMAMKQWTYDKMKGEKHD